MYPPKDKIMFKISSIHRFRTEIGYGVLHEVQGKKSMNNLTEHVQLNHLKGAMSQMMPASKFL